MLPSYSHNGRKRLHQLQYWKHARLAGGIFIVLLFFYIQFNFLNTKCDDVPAHVGELHGVTKQDWQYPDNEVNEQADLRESGNFSDKTNASNHVTGDDEKARADYDAAKDMLADNVEYLTSMPSEQQEFRRLAVRNAMKFAWGNYEEHAFGGDEVGPKNGLKLSDVWGNIACSLVDGMDTLWIMDLKDEFQRARDYVATQLDFSHLGRDGNKLSVFETIIREVGGLLSAFEHSRDAIFKQKAKELMDLLTPAYDEDDGVFYTYFNPYTQEKSFSLWSHYRAYIADVGTLQLETRYLSDITDDPKYAEMGNAFYKIVKREGSYQDTGLFPVHYSIISGEFATQNSHFSFSALGDSFYEYLLKVYVYSGKREEDKYLRELYDDAIRGMEKHLLYFSITDNLYFLHEMPVPLSTAYQYMDHLVCFVPGMLALGTLSETQDHAKNVKHLDLAEKLMETCYQFYHRQATGLSPDRLSIPKMRVIDPQYRLRPEAVESLFYLYRITKNPKYREYGWEIFEALETHAKTNHGYGAILNVTQLPAQTDNKMESFFMAETLKYHYLLQAPESLIPLDKYIFNTEAHPLRIRI